MSRLNPTHNLLASVVQLQRLSRAINFNWRPEMPRLWLGIVGMLIEIVARLLEPWPLKFIIDDVIGVNSKRLPGFVSSIGVHSLVVWGAIAVVLIALIRAGAQYVSTVSFAIVGNRFLIDLRCQTFDHIQRLPIRFHDQTKSGDLVTRLVSDMGRIQEVGVTALLPMIVHSVTLVVMVCLMLAINIQLGLFALCVFPLFWLLILRTGGQIRMVARDQRKREGKLGAASAEAISAIRTVQAMGLEQAMSASFGVQNRRSAKQSVKGKKLAARLERSVDVLIAVATAVVLWRGALLVIQRILTPGDLLVFLAYLKNAFKPMRDMAKYSSRISSAYASAERIVDLLETPLQQGDAAASLSAPQRIERIRFHSVSLAYNDHAHALSEISFQAERNQLVALVGPSGAGKSSLINLLVRLYEPTSGSIRFDDRDIRQFDLASLRQSIAIVPQESILFNMSIRDNIAIGCDGVCEDRIAAASSLAGADEFIHSMKHGYDTIISERGSSLSGGQQRRLSIARAAVRDAPILILDEPMAGLDLANRRLIVEALGKLRQGRICLMIVHDIHSALEADYVLVLQRGRIVERGTPADLMGSLGHFSSLMTDSPAPTQVDQQARI